MIIKESINTIVKFAEAGDSSTLAVGHTDQAHLFLRQLPPPPKKIFDQIFFPQLKLVTPEPNNVLTYAFSTIKDLEVFRSAVINIRVNILVENLAPKISRVYGYNDSLFGKMRLIASEATLTLIQEELIVENQIWLDPPDEHLLNGIPKTIFKFTLPESTDSLVCILDRIKFLMLARENSFAMAC